MTRADQKMRIGIITIPDYNNYGNRLQNYAVKRVFEQYGFTVDTLELNDPVFTHYQERKKKLLLKKFRLTGLVRLRERIKKGRSAAKRYTAFQSFTQKYLHTRYEPTWSEIKVRKWMEEYTYFVFGSDQIWNPGINTTPTLLFGTFVPPSKRLYFSPSFGVSTLPEDYRAQVADALRGVRSLSVREETGKALLATLTDADVQVLCDPTLCISAEEWRALAKPAESLPPHYIASYFLGSEPSQLKPLLDQSQEILHLPVHRFGSPDSGAGYCNGPRAFLYDILHADLVLTNSFHGVVFSILFERPFVVFSRRTAENEKSHMDSRVDDLLHRFGLSHHKYYEGMDISAIMNETYASSSLVQTCRTEVNVYFQNILAK